MLILDFSNVQAGLSQLQNAFPAYHVTPIRVQEGLHLKSFLSMAGPDLMAIGTSKAAQAAKQDIETKGKFLYNFISCHDNTAANCLYVNGTLIHVSPEDFPKSSSAFQQLSGSKIALSASQLNKVDGCFTCCSVLIK